MVGELLQVRVKEIVEEAIDIRSFEFIDSRGDDLPPFTAGAHIDVHLPGGIIRQYSLSNAAEERQRYVVAVLNEPDGRGGSAHMHTQVHAGDLMTISQPLNNFPLADEASRHLLIAGGIGITPILSMIRQLERSGGDYHLH